MDKKRTELKIVRKRWNSGREGTAVLGNASDRLLELTWPDLRWPGKACLPIHTSVFFDCLFCSPLWVGEATQASLVFRNYVDVLFHLKTIQNTKTIDLVWKGYGSGSRARDKCGDLRTACGRWFSPSSMWIPQGLNPQAWLGLGLFSLSHLIGPGLIFPSCPWGCLHSLRDSAVFLGAFEVRSLSLWELGLSVLWSSSYNTKMTIRRQEKGRWPPSQLVLCTYGENCDFSQGPQIIGKDGVEILWKNSMPPIKTWEDASNSSGFQLYLLSSAIYETDARDSRYLSQTKQNNKTKALMFSFCPK